MKRLAVLAALVALALAALFLFETKGPPAPPSSEGAAAPVAQGDAASAPQVDAAPPEIAPLRTAEPAVVGDAAQPVQTLRGRVLLAATGKPASGARVEVRAKLPELLELPTFASRDAPGAGDRGEPRLASAETGDDGRFVLKGEDLAGFLAPSDPFLCAADLVQVDADVDVEAPDLRVDEAGALAVVVTDPGGAPIEGATVELQSRAGFDIAFEHTPMRAKASAKTDAAGRHRFDQVPAGATLVLSAKADGWIKVFADVEVAARQVDERTLVLGQGAAVRGKARDVRGGPVEGARIIARSADALRLDPEHLERADAPSLETTTDAAGRFVLKGLPKGKWTFEARSAAHAGTRMADVAVAGDMELPQDLVLGDGRTIAGVVVDADGKPVARATLGVRKSSALLPGGLGMFADAAEQLGGYRLVAGDDGRFVTQPLSDGRFDLVAESKGFCRGLAEKVTPGAAEVKITLARKGAIEGIAISMVTGEPLKFFQVAAQKPFSITRIYEPETFIPGGAERVASKDGAFRIDDLAAGDYAVNCIAPEHARCEFPDVKVKAGETTRGVILRMMPQARIRGRVVDKATGAPIAGARLTTKSGLDEIRPDPLESSVRTDGEGAFDLSNLASGRYTLSVSARGYAPASAPPIALAEGQTYEGVSIALPRGASIHGSALKKDKSPRAGAMVTAVKVGSMKPALAITDAQGAYRIEGLSAGSFTVTLLAGFKVGDEDAARSMLDGMQNKSVQLKESQDATLDFVEADQRGDVVLEGTVSEGDHPVAGAMLSFAPEDAEAGMTLTGLQLITTDESGHYRAEGMRPGDWVVTVQSAGSLSDTLRMNFECEIPRVPLHHQDFAIPPSGIGGTLREEGTEQPIAGARVSIDAVAADVKLDFITRRTSSRRVAELFTDEAGRYRARGLEPGRYAVVAGGSALMGIGAGNWARSKPRDVEVPSGGAVDSVDFLMAPGGSLEGTVRDAEGSAIAGAEIYVVGQDLKPRSPLADAFSDESGSFRADGLEEGRFYAIARATGFAPSVEANLHIERSRTPHVDLVLKKGAELTLELHSASGAATGGAKIALVDGTGIDLAGFVSLGDILASLGGTFGNKRSLGPIAPGTYHAMVTLGGTSTPVEVVHGAAPQTVTVELP